MNKLENVFKRIRFTIATCSFDAEPPWISAGILAGRMSVVANAGSLDALPTRMSISGDMLAAGPDYKNK